MKTSLSHLPQHKQDELRSLTDIILAKVPAEIIILFGSYARGEWVEDYQEKYEYVSDFDILVITKDRISAKQGKIWWDLNKEISENKYITRTSIIQHSIGFVNDKVERNHYFFADILKEGIILFDSGRFKLSEPKDMKLEERRKKAEDLFRVWFTSANHFFETFIFQFENNWFKEAAFLLHQTTERYYVCILLVFTDYKPKIHDIDILGKQAEKLHPGFGTVFPKTSPEENRLFELLRKAYIDSRYDLNYKIEKSDLEYLKNRVRLLRELTERFCNERITTFTEG